MATAGKRRPQGQLRIIGGAWRGRKLQFAPGDGLRPTSDRMRETLFNWLAPHVHNAHCADLFAGSGALGLEALSRGAAHCDFVDTAQPAITQIAKHLQTLGATDRGTCHTQSAHAFLQDPRRPYDIVFVDPPFNHELALQTCAQLHGSNHLATGALVYVETGAAQPSPEVPGNWRLHREKRTGGVYVRLYAFDD
ncbi:MAG: 16S rRNA (guanine(966)-N(2))-methyltransferase [Halioglobus sp.]